jgi:hypothetical protein
MQNMWLHSTYKIYFISIFGMVGKNGADGNTLIVLWVKNRCVTMSKRQDFTKERNMNFQSCPDSLAI